MNKKFDRVLQWGKEKMGNDQKTSATDEFKSMEAEMTLRNDGMEKLHSSASIYIKSLSKRREGDDKEKMIPVDIVGQAMVTHGEEFEHDSLYGQCLASFGRAHESIARVQESYVETINENWLLSLERSLTQMKEYQAARKKLESRRLAYDATLSKMQKQKKEDIRVEEELRSQRIKYEESSDDVQRRMHDIQEAEADTLEDLGAFLDSELEYYDKCRTLLMRVKEQWPAKVPANRLKTRSRSNTSRSFTHTSRAEIEETPPPQPERPSIRSSARATSTHSSYDYDNNENYRRGGTPDLQPRPTWNATRSATVPTTGGEPLSRTSSYDSNSTPPARMLRTVTEPIPPPLPRGGLRPTAMTRTVTGGSHNDDDVFADDRDGGDHVVQASGVRMPSRTSSSSSLTGMTPGGGARKIAPPPPISRIKKPPPPPPVKRAGLSSLSISDQ